MYIFKNTGTMVIGVSDSLQSQKKEEQKESSHDFQIVASDTTVFQDYTKDYYNIHDKEIIKLSLTDQVEHHKIKQVAEERARVEIVPPHKHYYTMEMEDEPECVNKALNFGSRLMGGKAMVRLGGLDNNE